MADDLSFKILANGKPAENAIDGVKKKTKDLGNQTKRTGDQIDGSMKTMTGGWMALGARLAAVAASMAIVVDKGNTFDKMAAGLTDTMKAYAHEMAGVSDTGADVIAGMLTSAQTAGLNEEAMKGLVQQALALKAAYPLESSEAFNENLIMLNTSTEVQGFLVDIMEQKLGRYGVKVKDVDLNVLSLSQKQFLLKEAIEAGNKALDANKFRAVDKAMADWGKTLTTAGEGLMDFIDRVPLLSLVSKVFETVNIAIFGLVGVIDEALVKWAQLVHWWDESVDSAENLRIAQLSLAKSDEKLAIALNTLTGKYADFSTEIEEAKNRQKDFADENDNLADRLEVTDAKMQIIVKTLADAAKGTEELGDEFSQLSKEGQTVATGISKYFTNMAMGVKTSFKDMARSIVSILLEMQIKAFAAKALLGFGFHTGTTEVKHTGGAIGTSKIPSFHTGTRSDERLAKLQVGEAVINRGGAAKNRSAIEAMNKGYSVGGSGGNVTTAEINFNVQAIDAVSFNSYLVNNKGTIESIINSSLASNGSVRRTIRQVI